MRIIGLTGGIACGKSNVSDALRELGARIVDGDRLSRALTAPGGEALPAIRARFGEGVFCAPDVLDRRALAELIFSDDAEREALDGIMQPLIRRMIGEEIARAEREGAALCVLDMPLLYEQGLDGLCARVWCVTLPEEEQIARLMARDGLTQAQAEARLRSQMPAAEKARRAEVRIDTSGTIEETRALIPELYREELATEGGDGRGAAAP